MTHFFQPGEQALYRGQPVTIHKNVGSGDVVVHVEDATGRRRMVMASKDLTPVSVPAQPEPEPEVLADTELEPDTQGECEGEPEDEDPTHVPVPPVGDVPPPDSPPPVEDEPLPPVQPEP